MTHQTPQQNGVVERKNRTLQEMTRTILNESNVEKYFLAEATNTSCYILNRVSIRKSVISHSSYWNCISRMCVRELMSMKDNLTNDVIM